MIEATTNPEVKQEQSAVEILLNKINMLEEDIKFLKWYHTISSYDMILNAPDPIVRINTQPDAIIVEYHSWRREFIPLCITQCMKY